MLRILTIASICCASFAAAQDTPATLTLSTSRLNSIALRGAPPEQLPDAIERELEQAFQGLNQKRTDTALPHWQDFLRRRELLDANFDAGVYIDYLLHRIAATRNAAVNKASRRLRFYDAQETAVFEHVSTIDKQISIYAGADKPQVPLRELQLPDYADNVNPVTLAPAETADMDDLIASLQTWRARVPAISEARENARTAFVEAVAADATLGEELHKLDGVLRAEVKPASVRDAAR